MKNNETFFKLEKIDLEPNSKNKHIDKDLISYKTFIENKYKYKTEEDDPLESNRNQYNEEINLRRFRLIADLFDEKNPGNKAKKQFDDIRRKLRPDEKIQTDLGLKIENSKPDEKIISQKDEVKFSEIEDDIKNKFRHIFNYKNTFHKIILSFFGMLNSFKKSKKEFAIIFRFFGHSDEDIEEFIYEFNAFCNGIHPRYCGEYGFPKIKFNGTNNTKDYTIHNDKFDNFAVSFRNKLLVNECFIFNTYDRPEKNDYEDMRDNIEDFYENINKANNETVIKICKGYNNIYLNLIDKLSQFSSFVIIDDNSYYTKCNNKNGKLMLIDPYDYETLQIFFDYELNKFQEKINVVDIVTGKVLDYNYCIDKFIVDVDARKAISETNYFTNKIEECEINRINEIKAIGIKEIPLQPHDTGYDFKKEIRHLSSDVYLEMTLFPLLNTALNIVDKIRPENPIPFIANFMLRNKQTIKNISNFFNEKVNKSLLKGEEKVEELEKINKEIIKENNN